MRVINMIAAAVLFATPLTAVNAATYDIDMSHSEVGFAVKHMMVSNTKGKFNKAKSVLELDEKDATKSKVDVEIDVVTIDTDNADRDNHLRSPDFFEAEKFPKMTFKSNKVTKAGNGYKVQGDLTIKGVTKPVTLDVTEVTKAVKDPWGNERIGVNGKTVINRKDFGLTWNKALEAGGVAVGDDVTISIEAEYVKRKAP